MEKIIIDKHKSEYEIRILTKEDNYKIKIIKTETDNGFENKSKKARKILETEI